MMTISTIQRLKWNRHNSKNSNSVKIITSRSKLNIIRATKIRYWASSFYKWYLIDWLMTNLKLILKFLYWLNNIGFMIDHVDICNWYQPTLPIHLLLNIIYFNCSQNEQYRTRKKITSKTPVPKKAMSFRKVRFYPVLEKVRFQW